MQIIKKYANRKLYHTNQKQYITLEGIAHLIQSGYYVQIIDNETGDDITSSILAQVVVQVRGRSGAALPTTLLTSLIRFGGDTITSLRQALFSSAGAHDIIESEIARRIEYLRTEGTIEAEEATRLRHLLLSHETPQETRRSLTAHVLSGRNDVAHLHQQLDSLVSEVEQMIQHQTTSNDD